MVNKASDLATRDHTDATLAAAVDRREEDDATAKRMADDAVLDKAGFDSPERERRRARARKRLRAHDATHATVTHDVGSSPRAS